MMSSMWLACCAREHTAQVRREIEARDGSTQLVRFRDLKGFAAAADVLAGVAAHVMIYVPGERSCVVETVAELAGSNRVQSIVVLVDELDPNFAAQLCRAGATEVAAAERDAHRARSCSEGAGTGEVPDMCSRDVAATPVPADGPSRESFGGPGEMSSLERAYLDRLEPYGSCAEVEERFQRASEVPADYEPAECGTASEGPSGVAAPEAECPAPMPPPHGAVRERGSAPSGADPIRAREERPAPAAPPAGSATGACAPCETERSRSWATTGPRAPLIVAISGRGGCGKTTLIAAMAWCSARMGLRTALIDLDLMFGNQFELMGIEDPRDLAGLAPDGIERGCSTEGIEDSAMRIAPCLTLWGPCALPEQAELLSRPAERLIDVLRHEADVIFADTPASWGDAAACAVSRCDRCLVVGASAMSIEASTARIVELAGRIGVPRTRMTSVYNRYGSPERDEDRAMRFEMASALRSRVRISDGGTEVSELLSFGHIAGLMTGAGKFARDIEAATREMLRELGCAPEAWEAAPEVREEPVRPRIRLPWRRGEEAMAR